MTIEEKKIKKKHFPSPHQSIRNACFVVSHVHKYLSIFHCTAMMLYCRLLFFLISKTLLFIRFFFLPYLFFGTLAQNSELSLFGFIFLICACATSVFCFSYYTLFCLCFYSFMCAFR